MQADRIYCGDALTVLKTLPDNSVNCCVTSPPYYALRDYGVDGQIGREETPALYVERRPCGHNPGQGEEKGRDYVHKGAKGKGTCNV